MEIKGIITAVLPMRSGTSARGEWKSQDFVLEVPGRFTTHICFSVFGEERINKFPLQVGESVSVAFDIDAREYQGKWYNDIKAFDVRRVADLQNQQQPQVQQAQPQGDPFGGNYGNNDNVPY